MNTLQKMSENHGWPKEDLLIAKKTSVVYREFKEGVVILSDLGTIYVMTAFSEGNKHSLSMWRVIRDILKNYRDKTIITSYTDNREKLLKASERYNYSLGKGDIVIFNKQDKE